LAQSYFVGWAQPISDWGNTEEVRVVWLVQMLTDHCDTPAGGGDCVWTLNTPEVVRAYPDSWYLTGMAVQENHGIDVAVIDEDPSQKTIRPGSPV